MTQARVLVFAVLVAACAGFVTAAVEPAEVTLAVGEGRRLGTTAAGGGTSWTSADPSVAAVISTIAFACACARAAALALLSFDAFSAIFSGCHWVSLTGS